MRHTLSILLLLSGGSFVSACLDSSASGDLVPPTVDEDTSLPQRAFNGSNFHFETFGDPSDPVIVFLHGGPGNDYRGLLRLREPVAGVRLEDEHFLVFWDQRGSGLSRRHDASELGLDVYDDDLLWIVDHFSPERPVILIGHSWGGMYATSFVSQHPTRVKGVVLMEPGPLTGALFEEVKDQLIEIDPLRENINDYLWAQRTVSSDDHASADFMLAVGLLSDSQPAYHLSEKDPEPFWRLGAVANAAVRADGLRDGKPAWDFTQGLGQFQAPVLFEASEHNTAIGAEFQRRQMAFYANAQLEIVKDAGHDFPWTQAQGTLEPVFAYLDEIESTDVANDGGQQ